MNTPRTNLAAPLTRRLAAARALRAEPFCLVDVGASGGIAQYWRQFEPDLAAFGFEPMVEECARLNAASLSPAIRYFDTRLVAEGYEELFPPSARAGWNDWPFKRTSAGRAQELLRMSYGESVNISAPQTMSSHTSTLDRFFAERPGQSVDFIKVDTDGYDYEVLRGAQALLRERQVIGVLVEVPFHGITHPHSQLFSNIDRFLRENGFGLFDLETYRYSRASLPDGFVYDLPAQTFGGQAITADALYFRDVCAPGYAERWSLSLPPYKLAKLACALEIFGMADCAAEILLAHRAGLAAVLDVDEGLDLLARAIYGPGTGYRRLLERFESDPRSFYGSARRPTTEAEQAASLAELQQELRAMKRSRSWRLTAPLRALNAWLMKWRS